MKPAELLSALGIAGTRGLTVKEVCAGFGAHHGSASAMLSHLHQKGQILRLDEKRDRCSIYVRPEHADNRPTHAPRPARTKTGTPPTEQLEEIEALREQLRTAQIDLAKATAREAATKETLATAEQATEALRAEIEAAVAHAHNEGSDEGWASGYDAGVIAGKDTASGDGAFAEGRALGRSEGEEAIKRHVGAVSIGIYKMIAENEPVRSHFNGCYKVHPSCAVRAVAQSVGIDLKNVRALPKAI